jgi:hypothetical protein
VRHDSFPLIVRLTIKSLTQSSNPNTRKAIGTR